MSAIHHSHAWAKLAKARRALAEQRQEPCYRCGLPIDYTLSGMHKWGPQVDHTLAATLHPGLAMDPRLLAVSHRWCNQRHGARLGGKAAKRKRPAVIVGQQGYPSPP